MTDAIPGVNQADYMKLFMMELSYQDPLKPIDNREFMAQMAQFSALQSAQESSDALVKIDNMTRANQAMMLIGRNVTLNNDGGSYPVHGIIFTDEGPKLILTIDGSIEHVMLKDIKQVNDSSGS